MKKSIIRQASHALRLARGVAYVCERRRLLGGALVLWGAVFAMHSPAPAALIYWDGSTNPGTWGATANWSTASNTTLPDPGAVPGSSDTAIFNITGVNSTQTINLGATQSAAGLTFNSTGAVTLQGGGTNQILNLGTGGILKNAASGAATIGSGTAGQNVAISLQGAQSWINNGTGTLTINNGVSIGAGGNQTLTLDGTNTGANAVAGIISDGASTLSISKTGLGAWNLSGANTYTGSTNISGGTLTISNSSTFTNTSAINLSGTGRLDVNVANQSLAKLASPPGTGVVAGTFLRYSQTQATAGAGNGPGTIFGTVELNVTNVNPNYTLDFGAGSTFTSVTTAIYTSAITLSGNASIDSTAGIFNGNGMNVSASTAGLKTLTLTGTNTGSISGVISNGGAGGTIGLTKTGTGTWNLTGANTYTGATLISAGRLNLGTNNAIGSLNPASSLTNNATLGFVRNNTMTQGTDFNSVIAGTGDIIQGGSGTTILNGANTFSGKTSIAAGVLSINSIKNVGGVANALGQPVTVANGTIDLGLTTVTGQLTYTGGGDTTDRVLNLVGTTGGATIDQSGAGLLKFTSAVTANGTGGIGVKTLTLQGSTAGTGEMAGAINILATNLVKAGTGTWVLSGANTFTGTTTISGGTLQLNHGLAAQNSTVSMSLANGLTFGPSVGTFTLGGLTGANNFSLTDTSAAAITLRVGNNNTSPAAYSGIMSGGGALTKVGTGTLTLSGANNYTGGTNVTAGTLLWSGANNLPTTGTLAVNGGNFSLADGTVRNTSTAALSLASGSQLTFDWSSAGTVDKLTSTAAATTVNGSVIGISINPLGTPTGSGLTLLSAPSGLQTGSTQYFLANNTNFTATLGQSDTAVTIGGYSAATALTTAFWKGGLAGAPNVWAYTSGATSNWTATAGGAVQGLAPGSAAAVTISATSPTTAPTSTVLGSDMSISGLTISDTTNGLRLNADGHRLTIGTGGITVSASVPPSTIGADVVLGGAQTWTNNSTAPLTVSGSLSGTGTLATAGTGTVVLSGFNSTSTGVVTVGSTSTLRLVGELSMPNPSSIAFATTLNLNGTLDLRSDAGGNFSGGIGNGTSGATINVDRATPGGIGGVQTVNWVNVGGGRMQNVTGGHGYALALNMRIQGSGSSDPLNAVSANVFVNSILVHSNNPNALLGGYATGNTVSSIQTAAGQTFQGGTWTLLGSNHNVAGYIVSAGLLKVDGTANNTSMAINGGALGGTGTVLGAVTVAAGAGTNLADGSVGTLSLGSTLALNGTAANRNNLFFDLGNGSSTDKITVTGAATNATAGGLLVSLNQLTGTSATPGTYTLIQGGAGSSFNAPVLATTRAGGNVYSNLTQSGNDLQVTVAAGTTGPADNNSFWKGSTSVWNTAQWYSDSGGVTTATTPGYQSNVRFSSTTSPANLTNTLGQDFEINSLTVDLGTAATTIGGTNTLTIDGGTANGNRATQGITVNNAAGTTISSKVGLGASQTWTVASGATLTVSGAITDFNGGYTLTKEGLGTLVLSGSNTYAGGTTLNDGTLQLNYATNNNSKLSDIGILTLGGGTVSLSGGSHQEIVPPGTVLSAGRTTLVRPSGTSTLIMPSITPVLGILDVPASVAGTATLNDDSGILGAWVTVGGADWGVKSASAASALNGITATFLITAYTAYTNLDALGSTIASTPTTYLNNVRLNTAAGAGNISLGGTTTTINTLLQNTAAAATVDTAGKTLATTGIMIGTGRESLTIGAAAGDGTLRPADSTDTLVLNNNNNAKLLTVNAVIANNAYPTSLATAGNVVLNGVNTYTGNTGVGGTLTIGGAGQLQSGNYAGNIVLATSNGLLKYNSSASQTLSGILSGAGGLNQSGPGSLTLSNSNSYTGGTTINGGKLLANNVAGSATGSGAVAVNSGGTLGGTGFITGSVAINNGGTISPGNSPGILSVGTTTWNTGGNYNWQIVDATGAAGSGFDQLAVTGTLTISNGFNFNLWSLSSTGPDVNGPANNFNNTLTQYWVVATTTGGLSGVINLGSVIFNTSANNGTNGFINSLGGGSLSLIQGDGVHGTTNDVVLKFTTAPIFDYYWTGANATKNWNSTGPTNWSTDLAGASPASSFSPAVTSKIYFGAGTSPVTTTSAVEAAFSVDSLNFNSNASGLQTINAGAAGALTLNSATAGIVLDSGSGGATINVPLSLAASQNWTNNSSALLTVSGTVNSSSSGTKTLTNNGSGSGGTTISGNIVPGNGNISVVQNSSTGALTLSGTNTFAGGVTLTTGTLKLGSTTALGATAGSLTIATGTLDSTVANLVNANNNAQTWNGDFTFAGTNSLDLGTGAVSLGSTAGTRTLTVNANTLTVGGIVSNGTATGLTKAGAGTLKLSGSNTYTGATNITAGTLSILTIQEDSSAVANSLGLPGVGANSIIGLANSGTLQYLGSTAGSSNRVIQLTTAGGGTFTVDASGSTAFALTGGVTTAGTSGTSLLALTGTGFGSQSGTIVNGTGSNTTALSKGGAGTWTLGNANVAANTYTGLTTVGQGVLILNKAAGTNAIAGDGSTGTTDVSISGGTLRWSANNQVADNVTVDMSTGAFELNGRTETLYRLTNAGGTFSTGVGGQLIGTGASVVWSGGTNTINADGSVTDAHVSITGGTNTVQGAAGPPSGTLGGVLHVQTGGVGLEMTGATLTLNSDATSAGKLLLDGDVTTFGSATTSTIANGGAAAIIGTVDLDAGTRTFTVANGAALVDMSISAGITNGALTKDGAGRMELSAANSYGGNTDIVNGTLAMTGSGTIDNSPKIIVRSGAQFDVTGTGGYDLAIGQTLAGSGTVLGDLTIGVGSTLSPGDTTGPGLLSFGSLSDTLTWDDGGSYLWEINDATGVAGGPLGWDFVSILGNLDITSTITPFTVNITGPAANFVDSNAFWTIATAGNISGFNPGNFNLLDNFSTPHSGTFSIVQSGNNVNIVYTAGGGGPVSATPEPSTVVLALLGLASLGGVALRRRRRV